MRIGQYSLNLREISGGLADLGVLVPLGVALISINGLNPTSVLLGVGIIYILSGWYFKIPMPVQPLKSLAIIAIAQSLSPSVIAAAALLMALVLAFLSITGGIKFLERVIPSPVIRGIQIGLGLLLIKSAYQMIFQKSFLFKGEISNIPLGSLTIPTGIIIGVGSALLLIFLIIRLRSLPAALIIIAIGIGIGLVAVKSNLRWVIGPMPISFGLPKLTDFPQAFFLLVIPQVPLTLANSIYATADAAKMYFGEQARKATPTRIAWSIVLGNLWAGVSGGLPNCHGSGGLTAHYRLGARTPMATSFLGLLLIIIAVIFGRSSSEMANLLPAATLGAILFYVGLQHILLGLHVKTDIQLGLAVIVAVISMAFGGNLAIGAGGGLVIYWGFKWLSHICHWQLSEGDLTRKTMTKLFGRLGRLFPLD